MLSTALLYDSQVLHDNNHITQETEVIWLLKIDCQASLPVYADAAQPESPALPQSHSAYDIPISVAPSGLACTLKHV